MKMKYLILLLVCVAFVAILAGCRKKDEIEPDPGEVICGGRTVKTDPNAPKEIESDDLVSFEAYFYKDADFYYDVQRSYRFSMTKEEDGTYTIFEGEDSLSCKTDADFAAKLQNVIREQNLIASNGIYDVTSGIAPQYGPYELSALYASGESLTFCMNGDPTDKWTGAILDLFAKEFLARGVDAYGPSLEDRTMTRFNLDYAFDDIRHQYGEMLVPVTEDAKAKSVEDLVTNGIDEDGYAKKAFIKSIDRTALTVVDGDRMADLPENFYADLQEIFESCDAVSIFNGKTFPAAFDYEGVPEYFELYIEYESGKTFSAFSDDPEICEQFKPIAEAFSAYFEEKFPKDQNVIQSSPANEALSDVDASYIGNYSMKEIDKHSLEDNGRRFTAGCEDGTLEIYETDTGIWANLMFHSEKSDDQYVTLEALMVFAAGADSLTLAGEGKIFYAGGAEETYVVSDASHELFMNPSSDGWTRSIVVQKVDEDHLLMTVNETPADASKTGESRMMDFYFTRLTR